MWIRRQTLVQARMPSMRPRAINPRAPVAPARPSSPAEPVRGVARAQPQPRPQVQPQPAAPPQNAANEEKREGGFHESSYELNHGLQVSESDWPDDVTVPGALGDR